MAGMVENLVETRADLELVGPIEQLTRANVPLLIAKFKNGVNFDLQFPREDLQAVRNTNLIKHYAAYDERCPQLYLWLRQLMVSLGVKHSKEGLFSSYHILTLVIHFLHCTERYPNVLPILFQSFPHYFSTNVHLAKVATLIESPVDPVFKQAKSLNERSVGELAVELVNYYAKFNPARDVIHLAIGRRESRKVVRPDAIQLQITDPYSTKTVARSLLLPDALITTFDYVWTKMCEGEMLDSFPYNEGPAEDFKRHTANKPWAEKLSTNFQGKLLDDVGVGANEQNFIDDSEEATGVE